MINIYLIFDLDNDSSKTLTVPSNTRVRDLPRILGVHNWIGIELTTHYGHNQTFPLVKEPMDFLYHNQIYTAKWIRQTDEFMYEIIIID